MATPTAQTITVSPLLTTYPIGEVVQIATLFATDGVAVDPAVVKFSYKPVALGTATTLTYGTDAALVKDSTGNYHVNLDTTSYGGQWQWRFFSTGTSQSAVAGSFYVTPNAAVTTTVTPAVIPLTATVYSLNNILYADGFPGADLGDKLAAALAIIPSTGGIIDARGFQGAQAATVNPFAGITYPFKVLLGDCTISTTTAWTISGNDQYLEGTGIGTRIKITSGTPAAVLTLNGAATSYARTGVKNLVLDGNALATDGLVLKDQVGSVIDQVYILNVSGVGFHAIIGSGLGVGAVLCRFIEPTVSVNVVGLTSTNTWTNGIKFNDGSSTGNTIIGPRMEGITGGTGTGIWDGSDDNTYIGGTSESCDLGIYISATGTRARFFNIDMESNTQDILIDGAGVEFHGIRAASVVSNGTQVRTGAYHNKFFGGAYYSITLDNGSLYTVVNGPHLTSTFSDNSTRYTQVRDVWSDATGWVDNYGENWTRLKRAVEANTAVAASPNILTATESYKVLTNEGVGAKNYHTLPALGSLADSGGQVFTFVVQDANGIRVVANAGDTIRIAASVSAGGGLIECATVGNSVTVAAINGTEWVATSVVGTWTVT